ncbi:MAG: type II secretion system protein GspM [Burkholderiales bacterium]
MSSVMPQRAAPREMPAWRQTLAARWDPLAVREKRAVWIALAIVALALLWWLLLAPAIATLANASRQQPLLEAQLLRMKALQAEAQELQNAPKIAQTQALRALESATTQRLGATGQLGVLGDRATITLKGATADGLARWLAQARIDSRALPIEVRLARSPVAGSPTNPAWDGTVVLALPPR